MKWKPFASLPIFGSAGNIGPDIEAIKMRKTYVNWIFLSK